MNVRSLWAASILISTMVAPPAFAEDFWSGFTKDVRGLTGAIKDGIHDVIGTKKEVEETIEDARPPVAQPTGPSDDEPRYDRAWVAEIQQRLTAGGYDPGPIDGAFGKRTATAIAAFERDTGIPAEGLPRSSLMRALRAQTQGMQMAQPLQTAHPPPDGADPATGHADRGARAARGDHVLDAVDDDRRYARLLWDRMLRCTGRNLYRDP